MARKQLALSNHSFASALLIFGLTVYTSPAQSASAEQHNPSVPAAAVQRMAARHTLSPYRTTVITPRARDRYALLWGVEDLEVKAVESGQMIRFSYLVDDPAKAAQLNDKNAAPSLIDERARVRLEVPVVDKVGQLRQSSTPEAGRSYWMVFSNKHGVVKPGDRVSVVIGKFRVDGLFVR